MKPETMNVLGSGEVGHQLCWVAKALIGNQIYFLSGHDGIFTRNPGQFTLQKHHKVLNGRLYSPKYTLDMVENEPVKVITVDGKIGKKVSYILTSKWFFRIEMGSSMPIIAKKGPVPFTSFPEGVTLENFEERAQLEQDEFRNAFDRVGLPVAPISATERPRAWHDTFTKKIIALGLSVDDILVGNTVEVTTESGSKYKCLITDTGLDVQNGVLQWTLLTGFVGERLAGAVSWRTSPVVSIKKI